MLFISAEYYCVRSLMGQPCFWQRHAGHIRGSNGQVSFSFVTQVLLHQQECTRDNDWSLHVLSATLPGTSGTVQLLVEVTGEHAVRWLDTALHCPS